MQAKWIFVVMWCLSMRVLIKENNKKKNSQKQQQKTQQANKKWQMIKQERNNPTEFAKY